MIKNTSKIIIENSTWMYISKILNQLFLFMSTVLVIRKLPVDIFGTFNLLLNTFVVFEIFALSSISAVIKRYIPELINSKDYMKIRKLIRYSVIFSLCIFAILFFFLILYKSSFSSFFKIENFNKYLVTFIFCNVCHFGKIIIEDILSAFLFHKKTAIISILNSILKSTLYIILLERLSINNLLLIEGSLAILFVFQGTYVYLKGINALDKTAKPTIVEPVTKKRVIKYGAFSVINELGVGIVGKTSDYFIISAIANPYQVGLYAFGHRIYSLIYKLLPIKDFQTIIQPIFFRIFSQNRSNNEFIQVFNFLAKVMIPIYVYPGLFFLVFGKNIIILLFGAKYLEAYWVTVIMLLGNFSYGFFYPLALSVQLKERMDISLISKSVSIISIFAGIYFMKLFGILGVAITTTLGNFFKYAIMLFFMRKYTDIRYDVREYVNFIYIFLLLIPFSSVNLLTLNYVSLFVLSVVFTLFSFIVLIWFSPFNKEDLFLLSKLSYASKKINILAKYVSKIYMLKPIKK